MRYFSLYSLSSFAPLSFNVTRSKFVGGAEVLFALLSFSLSHLLLPPCPLSLLHNVSISMDVTRFCWSYLSEVSSLLFFSIPPLRSLFAPRHHPIIMSEAVDASRSIHFAFHLSALRPSLHPSRRPPSHCFCILSSALIDIGTYFLFFIFLYFYILFYFILFYFIFYFIYIFFREIHRRATKF